MVAGTSSFELPNPTSPNGEAPKPTDLAHFAKRSSMTLAVARRIPVTRLDIDCPGPCIDQLPYRGTARSFDIDSHAALLSSAELISLLPLPNLESRLYPHQIQAITQPFGFSSPQSQELPAQATWAKVRNNSRTTTQTPGLQEALFHKAATTTVHRRKDSILRNANVLGGPKLVCSPMGRVRR